VTTNIKLTALAAHYAGKLFLPPGYNTRSDAEMLVNAASCRRIYSRGLSLVVLPLRKS
jgi:hypothetical protein